MSGLTGQKFRRMPLGGWRGESLEGPMWEADPPVRHVRAIVDGYIVARFWRHRRWNYEMIDVRYFDYMHRPDKPTGRLARWLKGQS